MRTFIIIISCLHVISCSTEVNRNSYEELNISRNILDYRIIPQSSTDRSGLMFSDQGAWFAYSFVEKNSNAGGFSGPFLMTEQNGVWISRSLSKIQIKDGNSNNSIDWNSSLVTQESYASHLFQLHQNDTISVEQQLFYLSGNTALQKIQIKNISNEGIIIHPEIRGELFDIGIDMEEIGGMIQMNSDRSLAKGYLQVLNESVSIIENDKFYKIQLEKSYLHPEQTKEIVISHSFIFPEYSWKNEKDQIQLLNFDSLLDTRKNEKNTQLELLIDNQNSRFSEEKYSEVLVKSHLTLQNNWRIPAGEIKHGGLFPSYHYKWFNGFWSWDSWKHAVGLSNYDIELAKNQVKLMFDFQNENGFVADCVFRDTLIEKHNYRNTKPPLSAWAVANIFEKDKDLKFLRELYPKLKKYHYWWYTDRDHDNDGLCEYGSTDGSLTAAKWESGMDNAIRFDQSKMLKNSESAFSLDQESVDLNAYLYAEKLFLSRLAKSLNNYSDAKKFSEEAENLKSLIQYQFFDTKDDWFYDTSIDGKTLIKGAGSEGWIPLWASVASQEQAEAVKNTMMDPEKFFTNVPFQTMSADHEKFDPLNGYWRGPNWLDQAYFGVQGLRNYNYQDEADEATIKIIEGAEGVLGKGKSIRENYHPVSGNGLNAKNFSWSAAHLIMLLQEE